MVVQITFMDGIFNVFVYAFEDEMFSNLFSPNICKWLIQNEFEDNFSFKISSPPPAHRICGFNLFTGLGVTSAYRGFSNVYIEIRNNTSGQSLLCQFFVFPMRYARGVREVQSLLHTKLGGNDPAFDNGDDVSISVRPRGPAIQIRTVGVQWLHEEEGNDIQSKDGDAHVASIFRNYYCVFHGKNSPRNMGWWYFAKKGLENSNLPPFFV